MGGTPAYRIDGIYPQRQEGYFMQRVKLAAGVITAIQADTVAKTSERFGRGTIHLTSRGSMEIHWLREEHLPEVKRELALAGLTSRGACGGAVRGISCSACHSPEFPGLESLSRRLHHHFTGNPRFEGLPKKFKIGVEPDEQGGRHLIQDVALVPARQDGSAGFDVWIAGGLGRQPRPAFLLAGNLPEERLIPVIEAVIRVYAANAPPPKRLKYLAAEWGEEQLRRMIEAEPCYQEVLPPRGGLADHLVTPSGGQQLTVQVFAGQLDSSRLLDLAGFAERNCNGVMVVTANQDIMLPLVPDRDTAAARAELAEAVVGASSQVFRVCPGNHECSMGLAPTREIAAQLRDAGFNGSNALSLAISGCPNSCTQPQLAAIGIVVSKLVTDEKGNRTPRFDLYRRNGQGLGEKCHEQLNTAELLDALSRHDG